MRLDAGKTAFEELLRAIDRQFFSNVDIFAAAVISASGISPAYLFVKTEPVASNTAWDTMFSDAISSI